MSINEAYEVTEKCESENRSAINDSERSFTYEEAIELSGIGQYTRSLLAVLSLSLLSMAVDIFGFSIIVTGCACDFNLDHQQKSVLISVPFVGPILMAYFWGYLSDTQGRKKTLLIGLWGSFIASTVSAFSTHWYMLAVLKIVGTSLSSSIQAASYTYLGESCPQKVRGPYLYIMSSVMLLFVMFYVVVGYWVLNLHFHYNWIFITFTPWRLLTLLLAAPLGISALLLHFFYESPKFLLNIRRTDEGLHILKKIWERNARKDCYPVTKVILEDMKIKKKDESLASSLYDQIEPLFKRPLLWKTLQLFYLTSIIYGVNNSLIMWMPIIVKAFSSTDHVERVSLGLCDIIVNSQNTTPTLDTIACSSTINTHTLISGVTHGLIFSLTGLIISKLSTYRKPVLIIFSLIPIICCIVGVYNENDVVSLVLYVGMLMTNMNMGVLFTYFVDIYPTSYSGMASCLGVMVSRLSSLVWIHIVGALVIQHCAVTFYVFVVYLASGIVVIYFLPPDRPVKADNCHDFYLSTISLKKSINPPEISASRV